MQALKTIVITLGVVIVAGFGLLIYGLTQNWHRSVTPSAALQPAAPAGTWGSVTLGNPNERITGVTASGDLLVVQLSDGQANRLLVVDPRSGKVVGAFAAGGTP
jgi:hypothetical protein